MTTVPAGWEARTLGDLGRYLNGRGFKSSEWGTEGRPIIRIQNLTGSGNGFNYFAGEVEERYIVRRGDLLVSWAATLGAYFWDGPEAVLNQHIFKVESNIDKRFHKYLIESKIAEMLAQTHGSGMVHITKSKFDAIPVAIPPLDEQRRIVAILEDHLSRLDAAVASIGKADGLGRSLDESLLCGALDEWDRAALGDLLIAPLSNGRSVPTSNDGFPVLRLTSLKDGWIDLDERKNGAWAAEEARPFMVKKGDFLVSRGNGSLRLVGRGGLVMDEPDPVAYPDTLIRIRVDESRLLPGFLCLAWNSSIVRRQIESRAKTTAGIYKINQGDLRAIQVPLPPIDAQGGITDRLVAGRGGIQRLGTTCTDLGRRAEGLRRALLASAFSGQLAKEPSLV